MKGYSDCLSIFPFFYIHYFHFCNLYTHILYFLDLYWFDRFCIYLDLDFLFLHFPFCNFYIEISHFIVFQFVKLKLFTLRYYMFAFLHSNFTSVKNLIVYGFIIKCFTSIAVMQYSLSLFDDSIWIYLFLLKVMTLGRFWGGLLLLDTFLPIPALYEYNIFIITKLWIEKLNRQIPKSICLFVLDKRVGKNKSVWLLHCCTSHYSNVVQCTQCTPFTHILEYSSLPSYT